MNQPAVNKREPMDVASMGAALAEATAGHILARAHAILFEIGCRRAASKQQGGSDNLPEANSGQIGD